MVFEPETGRRWKLELQWRRFHRIVTSSASPAYIDWLEYMINGRPLSALLAGKHRSKQDSREAGPRPGPMGIGTLQHYAGGSKNPKVVPAHLEMLLTGKPDLDICPGLVPLDSGRIPLYVCPECGDYGCGTTCVLIERIDDATIVWHEFRDESYQYYLEHGDMVDLLHNHAEEWEDVGPFFFDYEQYAGCLQNLPKKPATVEFL